MILFLLLIAITQENCKYYYYLDNNNEIQCTSGYSCPEEYNYLIPNKNQCIQDCKKDPIYRYEYKYECLENCPSPETELINETYCSEICTEKKPYQNTSTHECVSSCDFLDLLTEKCVLKIQSNNSNEYENTTDFDFDKFLEELEKYFNSFNFSDLDYDSEDLDINNTDVIKDLPKITITTTENKNNNNTNININNNAFLTKCENILREYYAISNDDQIIFYQITNANKTEYEAYFPLDGIHPEKLDMSVCEDVISITIPVDIEDIDYYYNDTFDYIDFYNINCDIEKPYLNFSTYKCIEKCDINDILNYECDLYYVINDTEDISQDKYIEFQNTILDYVESIFTTEEFYENIKRYYDYSSDSNLITSGNMRISFTTSENKNKKENETSIDLGNCENILKSHYSIDKLYIKKIEYLGEENKVTGVDYDIYGEVDNSSHLVKLDKKYCQDISISVNIPPGILSSINNKLNNENEDDNNDICSYLDSDDDNKDSSYNEKEVIKFRTNKNLCADGCYFTGFENGRVKCNCGTTYITKRTSIFNFKVLSCKVFNNMKNIKSNYGFYVLTPITSAFFVTMIVFYLKGFSWLGNKMDEVMKKKFGSNIPIINNPVAMNFPPKKTLGKTEKKHYKKSIKKEKQNNGGMIPVNNGSKTDFIARKNLQGNLTSGFEQNLNSNLNYLNNNFQSMMQPGIPGMPPMMFFVPETDYELNWASYEEALKFDKRGFCGYYCSIVKSKNLLLLSFCSMNDYNSKLIKITFIFLSFAYHYTFNALLFGDASNNEKYEKSTAYSIPSLLYSSLLSIYILRALTMCLALNDKDVLEVKKQLDKNLALFTKEKKLKCAKIKITIFYLLNLIILIFSWYYLICFNAVFKKSQGRLITNTISSFIYSLTYPFLSNLFPAIFRNCALNSDGTNGCCYSLSKITQLIFI